MKTDYDAMNYPEASALDYPLIKLKATCAERDRLKAVNAEMLELLHDINQWFTVQLKRGTINAGTANRDGDLVSQIRAAIAKAEAL